ncbi:MAG: isoleucine--tRNA ligase [Deltaproteobacteria bacterium]|jgi:isoleucyl-tRNA synthetase|nr:isoleucine--tRNA ligase [Deltaproteobacteria bacterium]
MEKSYKDTLNLPKTEFPMKGNLSEREPKQLERWYEEKMYERIIEKNAKSPAYIMHDGPPYANGGLHLGTILNKILKDIVVKYKNMSGYRCEFVPGWDCHGLPIELGVEKKLGPKKHTMDPVDVREECREHARGFVDIQREEFKRLGVFARWDDPYLTMTYDYEASIAREFGKFVKSGSLYKGKRPIYWCASCKTALAEAEVEYKDHSSPSIYVKFKLIDDEKFRKKWKLGDEKISVVIWTTTPWTIPANLGIALNPELPYVAVKVDGEVWILAEGLLDSVMESVGKGYSTIVGKPSAKELEHKRCRHPLIDRESLIILGEHVTLEAGTGAVHTAPGHGQEDFDIGQQYGLEILAPVNDAGKFTNECGLSWLEGVFVEDANQMIIDKMVENDSLIHTHEISHSYPHCWRCKRPIIFRVTDQWFISMKKNELRKKALDAITKVQWIPPWGEQRISGMISARPDWCISRQRLWGVPVIALVCEACGSSHTTTELVDNAVELFSKEGADAWFKHPAADFKPKNFKCPSCGEKERFGKEPDILDVWFDSGVSYAAVLEQKEHLEEQADLYLEGSDQHRGWFHTSLLTSIGTRKRAPYKRVLTHGMVVDGSGRKYSKSAKNYVPPVKLINQHGAEILRLWVAAEDYRDDIRFSEEILKRCVEAYRKLRNTARYMLGNLSDFDPKKDMVPESEMEEIDRYALAELARLTDKMLNGYDKFEFHTIFHALNRFCTVEMSSFYLDILKDRLYAERADGQLRRSAQTVLWKIIVSLTKMMAPIFSFTSDEIWNVMPKDGTEPESVFLSEMPKGDSADKALLSKWERLMKIRQTVMKALEEARAEKFIGNSLAAQVVIECDEELKDFLKGFGDNIHDLFIVSGVVFDTAGGDHYIESDELKGLKVAVEKARGEKCERCWKYCTSVGETADHPTICNRCVGVL